jgi:hypothetical protein
MPCAGQPVCCVSLKNCEAQEATYYLLPVFIFYLLLFIDILIILLIVFLHVEESAEANQVVYYTYHSTSYPSLLYYRYSVFVKGKYPLTGFGSARVMC